jgi:poly(hydroxyalkanoate) granule-associated protein
MSIVEQLSHNGNRKKELTMAQIEIIEDEVKEEPNALFDAVRRVLMASIGAFVLAQEEVEEFVNKLIERGEIAEKDGRKLINEIVEKRRKKAQETGQTAQEEMDKRVEGLLDRLNIPTKSDIDALNAKVTELTEKVESLKKNVA